ncbi:MAG: VWA domain-containing protein [Desulfobacterales bacterium]|nr:VWA domain-containing protein [Desulfobacterales bacterium]MBF0395842.1 VWA domain-containing protein [Desulfobacterales bacterium]
MKNIAILFAAIFFLSFDAIAEDSEDKTLSPYFFVKSDNPAVDQLPLKSTSASVNIAGVIADIKVVQVYKNEGKNTLEAIYIFPASTRAAVYGMKMTIGQRTIVAKIEERKKAREDYEKAKNEGKSASLLEQERPNVFQMNVANILPGDTIKVEMSYTELLIPEDGIYEFAYPTVVGPRYSNKKEASNPPSEKWTKNPYLHQGETPSYTFDISVKISGSIPISDVTSTSHKVNVNFINSSIAEVKLEPKDKISGNKDYILKYRLSGGKIETGLLLYKGEKENFFLLMVQPQERIDKAQIPGREYIFIVDVSGSMHGFPLDISKKLLKDLISNLRPNDKFNVLLFSGGSNFLSEESLPANSENINKAIQVIDNQQGGGGTELLPALKNALSLKTNRQYSRTIVIVTDGYVSVEREAFDLIRQNLSNANMFAFGIGTSVNRYLIEGIARVGMGEPFIITKPEEAQVKADKFRKYIQFPLLTHGKIYFGKFDVYDVEPPNVPDVLANRPVIVFGKWRGDVTGKITLKGIAGDKDYQTTIDVSQVKPMDINLALKYLWARYKIALLSDYNTLFGDENQIKEVTNLGLSYSLLTQYTSFIAIDSEVRRKDGKLTTVNQPLPMPEGVSDSAVGGAMKKQFSPSAPLMSMAPHKESLEIMKEPLKDSKEERDVSIINIDKFNISNNLEKESVKKFIEESIDKIEFCKKKVPYDIITILISTDPLGKVKKVQIKSSGSLEKGLESCIIKEIKTWQFKGSKDGKDGLIEFSI